MTRPAALAVVCSLGALGAIGGSSACAQQRAEGPLAVGLGLSPAEAASALRRYDFCRKGEPVEGEQVFPACAHPGTGYDDAWVVARYQDGHLIRVQRFERWSDADRAQERWNQLVEKRAAASPASQGARDQIFARQRIPDGTRSWLAFSIGDELIGVYLLRPSSADDPSILEEIIPAHATAADQPPPPTGEDPRR